MVSKNFHESDPSSDGGYEPFTLVELARMRASLQPDRKVYTLLIDGEEEGPCLTFAQLDQQARSIAAMLQQHKGQGERALLLYPQGLEFIASFLGCLYAGVIAIPAPPPDPVRIKRTLSRLQSIVKDAQPSFVLTTSAHLPIFSQAGDFPTMRWVATDSMLEDMSPAWRDPFVESSTLAYLQYTSGSTSTPKGVMVSHANVLHNSYYISRAWEYGPDSKSLVWVPHYHDDGLVHGLSQPLYKGYQAYLMPALSYVQRPVRWLQAISRFRITHTGGPNFAYALCVRKIAKNEREGLELSSWRMAYNAAEPIRKETLDQFTQCFEPHGFDPSAFHPAFGLAEATLLVTTKSKKTSTVYCSLDVEQLETNNRVVESSDESGRTRILVGCGQPVCDTKIVIADPESLNECQPDQVGEIWISDRSVAQGYWNRPLETEETFKAYLADSGQGPFLRTGDLGFIKDGELFVTGRFKDLIIVSGINHYPQDIEWIVESSHPSIRAGCCAAFCVDAGEAERLIVAAELERRFVKEGGSPDAVVSAIRRAVAENNELEVCGVLLLKAGTIPKTSSGKIQRHACKAGFESNSLEIEWEWLDSLKQVETSTPSKASVSDTNPTARKGAPRLDAIRKWIIEWLDMRLGLQPGEVDARESFARYGLVSKDAVGLTGDLERWLSMRLPPTLVWEYPTIDALARHLAGDLLTTETGRTAQRMVCAETDPIAIIGIGCRFPSASGPGAFWELLRDGRDAISEVPKDRWSIESLYDADPQTPGKMNTRWGGFLEQVDRFDPEFFGISPREAARIDPQQRLLLEVAWEALEDAGQAQGRLAGSATGVFVGISTNEYSQIQLRDLDSIDAYLGTGNALSIAANRLSYFFDFHGPSIVSDTACSSSLVAVHLACRSLWEGEANVALAAGVNLILSPAYTINFTKAGAMAPDGRCKAFDSRANGYVRAEGAAVVILKPLSRAMADGDPIYALILGTAVNNDGRTNGLMAPNPQAQVAVLSDAYRRAGVSPGHVSYVEAHGTGTLLGDPIEARALGKVVGLNRPGPHPCAIGSVKTNIGHLESAAGIAGLIKVALSLKHKTIPASIHFENPNPHIPFEELSLRVQQETAPWPDDSRPRIAGVNSFGFGGTNAHAVLQEAPASLTRSDEDEDASGQAELLTLSAHSPDALRDYARSYTHYFREGGAGHALHLRDITYTASARRHHHDFRLSAVGRSHKELAEQLEAFLRGEARTGLSSGRIVTAENRKLVFVFPGQGSQWEGMARKLYEREPVFRDTLKHCDLAMRQYVEWSLLEKLAGEPSPSQLDEIDVIQPALFAMQVGLAALWKEWGIVPDAVVGQSMGEVAAACVAGALSLEDAAKVICRRSRLLKQRSGQGSMAVVELSAKQARLALKGFEDRLSIAVSSSPTSTVISGESAAMEELLENLQREDTFCRLIKVDVASHSPQMDPLREGLSEALANLQPRQSSVPIYSTVTCTPGDGSDFDGAYWWRNLREPVLFSGVIQQLIESGSEIFVEISPHPIVSGSIQQTLLHFERRATVLPSLRREEDERQVMLGSLGALYTTGSRVNWDRLYPSRGLCVELPSYPWQRQRFWLETDGKGAESFFEQTRRNGNIPKGQPLPDEHLKSEYASHSRQSGSIGDWLYKLEWLPQQRQVTRLAEQSGRWIVFANEGRTGEKLASALEKRGNSCIIVYSGQRFEAPAPGRYRIDPSSPEDFKRLLSEALVGDDLTCPGIAHLWALDSAPPDQMTVQSLEAACELCCVSVLHLVQALAATDWHHSPRLWLISRGVQALADQSAPLSIAQSPLWGLGRTISREHPELRCSNIDLDPADHEQEVEYLIQELLESGHENQLALRGDARYVARLERCSPGQAKPILPISQCERNFDTEDSSFRLEISEPGTLENLILRPAPRNRPEPGEVEIEIRASGLNFVDVVKALDLIPGLSQGLILPGGECAGQIAALGDGVEGFQVGDNVIAIGRACFGSFTVTDSSLVVAKPAHLSFEEAATIPVAFVTACLGLNHLARLSKGERVLIHSAAGGVGLAAVQLAQLAQSEIFATAGSAQKREFLRSLGIQHVFDSRSIDFAQEILELTDGKGVDVVLNSLVGEFMQKSLLTLGPYGRFVEIGKRDIYQGSQVSLHPFHKNLSYFAVDIERMCSDRRDYVGSILREVIQQVKDEALHPLPFQVFPISDIAGAFRHMAQAKHTGKIVVNIQDGEAITVSSQVGQTRFRPDGTYLITGGLGGLGLTVAQWMVQRDARHIVLVSRGTASSPAASVIEEMKNAGAQVVVVSADLAREDSLAGVWSEIEPTLPPLRGIIHAAGLLDDGILLQLDQDRFISVMGGKALGAWNLHLQTLESHLDFFVLFSSAASVLGPVGQGNYSAANAFLDSLAHYRNALGLPALSINWGPWAEVGLAARPDRGGQLNLKGFESIKPQQGLELLDRLIGRDLIQVAAMPVDWQKWSQTDGQEERLPLLSDLMTEHAADSLKALAASDNSKPIRDVIFDTDPDGRRQMLESHLSKLVARVLGLSSSKIDLLQPLNGLGLDSVMAVELKYRIENDLGVHVPVVKFLEGNSIASLASLVLDKMPSETAQASGLISSEVDALPIIKRERQEDDHQSSDQLLANLDQLSVEQLDSLLSELLNEEEAGA